MSNNFYRNFIYFRLKLELHRYFNHIWNINFLFNFNDLLNLDNLLNLDYFLNLDDLLNLDNLLNLDYFLNFGYFLNFYWLLNLNDSFDDSVNIYNFFNLFFNLYVHLYRNFNNTHVIDDILLLDIKLNWDFYDMVDIDEPLNFNIFFSLCHQFHRNFIYCVQLNQLLNLNNFLNFHYPIDFFLDLDYHFNRNLHNFRHLNNFFHYSFDLYKHLNWHLNNSLLCYHILVLRCLLYWRIQKRNCSELFLFLLFKRQTFGIVLYDIWWYLEHKMFWLIFFFFKVNLYGNLDDSVHVGRLGLNVFWNVDLNWNFMNSINLN